MQEATKISSIFFANYNKYVKELQIEFSTGAKIVKDIANDDEYHECVQCHAQTQTHTAALHVG